MLVLPLRQQSVLRELEKHREAGELLFSNLMVVSLFSRCENLAEVNTLLREHLDKASQVNSALKEDVGKLTVDWMRAREELEVKESEWCSEREVRIDHRNARGEWECVLFLAWKTCCVEALALLRMYWCWTGVWEGGVSAEGAGSRCPPSVTALLGREDRAGHCWVVTGTLVSLIVP